MTEIPNAADVVVIGGGTVGVSAAYLWPGSAGMRTVVIDRALRGPDPGGAREAPGVCPGSQGNAAPERAVYYGRAV